MLHNDGCAELEYTYHSVQKRGHPASLKVTLQIVDVLETGVYVSKSSISNSVGIIALRKAASLPMSLNLVRVKGALCTLHAALVVSHSILAGAAKPSLFPVGEHCRVGKLRPGTALVPLCGGPL